LADAGVRSCQSSGEFVVFPIWLPNPESGAATKVKAGGADGGAAGLSRVRKFDRPSETHKVAIDEIAISARSRPPAFAIRPENGVAAMSIMKLLSGSRRTATRAALCGGTSAAKWCFRGSAGNVPISRGE
jgi:hypothetical protein